MKRSTEELLEYAWLNLGELEGIDLKKHPFAVRSRDDIESPHIHVLRLMRNPEYFPFTCKHVLNVELHPLQHVILKEYWRRPFPMTVASRGAGKSFLNGLYAMLRALFTQGSKILFVGAAFRQAKVEFEYCENIWANAPVFRDICGVSKGRNNRDNGPRRDIDRCDMVVGDSIITALPLGTGEKIRGARATHTVAVEFSTIPVQIFETVVAGFGVVSASPIQNIKTAARTRKLKEMGLWTASMEEEQRKTLRSNQIILTGTAYYDFNHFAEYFRRYKKIIESRGDRGKLSELFGGEIDESFDWRDYSIIRVPIELMPEGFMDMKSVVRNKMTMSSSIYSMEYNTCHHPDTIIITNKGVKKIFEILPGDKVLTHKGRFRRVLKIGSRYFNGDLLQWRTWGVNVDSFSTPDHHFWTGEDNWAECQSLDKSTRVANLTKLNGRTSIDLRRVVNNWVSHDEDYIYPRSGPSLLDENARVAIRASKEPAMTLAKQYGVHFGIIYNVRKKWKKPKGAILAKLPLTYELGLVLGYYASEGSCGAKGKSVNFALDGHVNVKLESYVDELVEAIRSSTHLNPKMSLKHDNVMEVRVNSRLFVEFIKWACPGRSNTKFIRPKLLFSNPDFIKGVLRGYWNGDGHNPDNRRAAMATCVNHSLLAQMKLCLSYYNIASSLYPLPNRPKKSVFRNREYDCLPAFSLALHGENYEKFQQVIFDKPVEITFNHHRKVVSENGSSFYNIKSKKLSPYSGPVFDLLVEEDHSYSLVNATVHNCFLRDSDGFYRRSLIESCVTGKPDKPISLPDSGKVEFHAALRGEPGIEHYFGVDPASEKDNFSVVIVAAHSDHRRIVYSWTTTRAAFKKKQKAGIVKDGDFYGYCAKKIRELMKSFPCKRILMDSQGGGVAVREAFHDPDKVPEGELPIWEVIDDDPKKVKDTDGQPGWHILEMVNFAKADWVSEANHGMRKDFEDKVLLFPYFDPISIGEAAEQDKELGRVVLREGESVALYDTLEDAVVEIEELKDELATIVHTQTGVQGRDHWDTPEVKLAGGKKGRQRKDRYSALLMANMGARQAARVLPAAAYEARGGWAHAQAKRADGSGGPSSGALFIGPDWFLNGYHGAKSGNAGAVVRRD